MDPTFIQRLQTARPRLAAKARLQKDKVSGEVVLLYPEGVVLLNTSAEVIIQLCDGSRSFSELVAQLADTYQMPASALEEDVSDYLCKMHQQNLVELGENE